MAYTSSRIATSDWNKSRNRIQGDKENMVWDLINCYLHDGVGGELDFFKSYLQADEELLNDVGDDGSTVQWYKERIYKSLMRLDQKTIVFLMNVLTDKNSI
tara:strand:+ start:103 stop:405 length:303 start_codon:yes stop_codon:yes gene_type:complete